MNERFIYLMENYFDKNLNKSEESEFLDLVNNNTELNKEFEEQKRVKEVLSKMMLKNPSQEIWDSYWLGIYNRIERGFAWIIISIGAILVLGFSIIKFIETLYIDVAVPIVMKIGVYTLTFGFVILIVSLLRERIFTYKHDKYKEIQR